jgi:uncharacterized membrane protein affecting hemolysin expression
MNTTILFGEILLSLGLVLLVGVLVFSYLKHLKRTRYNGWKFLDYVSVGYAEHLYKKFIKRV